MNNASKKVHVTTPQFTGWATVTEYIAGELFPVQIRLDYPDSDDHYVKRVAKEEEDD